MKKILIIGICILLLPIVIGSICQDEQPIGDIPCSVVTPYINGNCGVYNYTVTNVNTSTVVDFGNMSAVGDGTYNFTFNQTEMGNDYSLFICDNSTASITITSNQDSLWEFGLIFLLGGISLILAMIGYNLDELNWPLRSVFLIGSLAILAAQNYVTKIIIENSSISNSIAYNSIINILNHTYYMIVIIIFFVVAYIGINILKKVFDVMAHNKILEEENG